MESLDGISGMGPAESMGGIEGETFWRILSEASHHSPFVLQKRDIVLSCGKGHEHHVFGKTEYLWDDAQPCEPLLNIWVLRVRRFLICHPG